MVDLIVSSSYTNTIRMFNWCPSPPFLPHPSFKYFDFCFSQVIWYSTHPIPENSSSPNSLSLYPCAHALNTHRFKSRLCIKWKKSFSIWLYFV